MFGLRANYALNAIRGLGRSGVAARMGNTITPELETLGRNLARDLSAARQTRIRNALMTPGAQVYGPSGERIQAPLMQRLFRF